MVTTYKSGSNVPAMLVLFPGSDSPSIVVIAAFSGILLILILPTYLAHYWCQPEVSPLNIVIHSLL